MKSITDFTSRVFTISSMASGAVFNLSDSSLLKIHKGDITEWYVDARTDAIVNSADNRMIGGGGGVDGAIHRVAGRHLRTMCCGVPQVSPGVRCPTGEARITVGFNLYASHVIHTVGPVYESDVNLKNRSPVLTSKQNSLIVAKENNIKYIAFPAISCGNSRYCCHHNQKLKSYPKDEAAMIAISVKVLISTPIAQLI
ncbi:unnamed protein product [Eruca vesicaria subsp. sativa]|uniref:Macro domain-containing protein n=1 Tax=Eruca vesicaria subsp. sativa TaxID=29727 RepID=A0ABC8J9N2_ERUVS|nr:unnamed protein product [Eruca vesicaria subsp. sativa]